VVVERGPEVFALESVDTEAVGLGDDVSEILVDVSLAPHEDDGRVQIGARVVADADRLWPYGTEDSAAPAPLAKVALVPYHEWASRGPSTMRVWLPTG
jgi:DUF1680 family protein